MVTGRGPHGRYVAPDHYRPGRSVIRTPSDGVEPAVPRGVPGSGGPSGDGRGHGQNRGCAIQNRRRTAGGRNICGCGGAAKRTMARWQRTGADLDRAVRVSVACTACACSQPSRPSAAICGRRRPVVRRGRTTRQHHASGTGTRDAGQHGSAPPPPTGCRPTSSADRASSLTPATSVRPEVVLGCCAGTWVGSIRPRLAAPTAGAAEPAPRPSAGATFARRQPAADTRARSCPSTSGGQDDRRATTSDTAIGYRVGDGDNSRGRTGALG
jgi:hypothetical protein